MDSSNPHPGDQDSATPRDGGQFWPPGRWRRPTQVAVGLGVAAAVLAGGIITAAVTAAGSPAPAAASDPRRGLRAHRRGHRPAAHGPGPGRATRRHPGRAGRSHRRRARRSRRDRAGRGSCGWAWRAAGRPAVRATGVSDRPPGPAARARPARDQRPYRPDPARDQEPYHQGVRGHRGAGPGRDVRPGHLPGQGRQDRDRGLRARRDPVPVRQLARGQGGQRPDPDLAAQQRQPDPRRGDLRRRSAPAGSGPGGPGHRRARRA